MTPLQKFRAATLRFSHPLLKRISACVIRQRVKTPGAQVRAWAARMCGLYNILFAAQHPVESRRRHRKRPLSMQPFENAPNSVAFPPLMTGTRLL